MQKVSKKTIGIIGGAGPMAGILLAQKVMAICQQRYGCKQDSDFPKLTLVSYPFSEMLVPLPTPERREAITHELTEAISSLKEADYLAIACNTLHSFLPKKTPKGFPKLINMLEETRRVLLKQKMALILCTSTSRQAKLHNLPCKSQYPEAQHTLDQVIDDILRIGPSPTQREALENLIKDEADECDAVVLGCTELSLLQEYHPVSFPGIDLIDPMETVADKLCLLTNNKEI